MSEESCWEEVDVALNVAAGQDIWTDRLPVPGGWLYRTILDQDNKPIAMSIVFVPRPPDADPKD